MVESLSFPCCRFTMWYKANCNVSSFHWTHFCRVNPGQSKHHKISTLKLEWILEVASAHTWLMNTSCPPKLISNHVSFPTSGDGDCHISPWSPFHVYTALFSIQLFLVLILSTSRSFNFLHKIWSPYSGHIMITQLWYNLSREGENHCLLWDKSILLVNTSLYSDQLWGR